MFEIIPNWHPIFVRYRKIININYKLLYTVGIVVVLADPAFAKENLHTTCGDQAVIELGKMGVVNEEVLQAHIDKIKAQLKKVRHARGVTFYKKQKLKQHLFEMQLAMQDLHNQMLSGGCVEAIHGASVEARVDVMEKQLKIMQQHLLEQERKGRTAN